jgi:AraC-like DNA-binding protein
LTALSVLRSLGRVAGRHEQGMIAKHETGRNAMREIAESLRSRPPELGDSQALPAGERDFIRRYAAYRDRLRFRVADPANRCDTYAVSPGMAMAVVDVGCTEEFTSRLSGQDIIEFHYRLAGTLELTGSWGEVRVAEPSCLLWYQPAGCDDAAERMGRPREQRQRWVSLYCDRRWLQRIGGAAASALLAALGAEGSDPGAPQYRLCSDIGALAPILRDIVGVERCEPLDWLLAVAKSHELLHASLHSAPLLAAGRTAPARLSARDRRLVALARDVLARDPAAPPRLAELARRIGVSSAKLRAGFAAEFGESPSAFVRRRRLELARELLASTDLQVREIARRVGYRHHSTFTAAFCRELGIAPKRLRRRGRAVR